MTRKLATIQRISKISPIENADSVAVASVLGWKVVVRKDEFREGDLIVYCEIDSVMPPKPEFEFLKERKYRVRTIKLRGQISQGICFPYSILNLKGQLAEGEDVTEILGVEKYIFQIPANLAGIVKGKFPSFMPHTDEIRAQVIQDVLTRHKGTRCYVTEKVDGSSVTFYFNKGEFGVCSRNLELKESSENSIWQLARELKIEEKLRKCGKNIALQGEIIGNGIQKNPLRLETKKILFFNAFDIDKYEYFSFPSFRDIMAFLELETVPILDTNFTLTDDIEELVELATSNSQLNPKIYREGIVIRSYIEKMDLKLAQGFGSGRVSFKVINPEYLLKYDA